MFITFEANEGAGKSTQARKLATYLEAQGHEVVLTREPGGSPGAEEIRSLIITGDADRWSADVELLLFTAARRDHIERVLRPALARGAIIVCDRYVGSTYALQGAGGMPREKMEMLFDTFCGLKPDLTLFLDIDPDVSIARGMSRLEADASNENRMELKGSAFHRKVSELFTRQFNENDEWVRVDADQDIESIHRQICAIVDAEIAAKTTMREIA